MSREVLTITQITINGQQSNSNSYEFLWICYDFTLFSQCEFSVSEEGTNACGSYFKHLKDKINEEISFEQKKRVCHIGKFTNVLLLYISVLLMKLSNLSAKLLPVTKYFNITIHANNYLKAFLWAVNSITEKKRFDIKVTNFLLSVFLDMVLGIVFLNWLNSKVSLDSSATIFLLTAESVVNSINDLINWLRGDPAGLKLNWAFNKILATFFLFHIEIWWTFLVYLKPVVKIIFQIFLKLGLLGITFQASITADLLALVSFHIYCIHAYAAKLYSIQTSTLTSLWRLFLGRKKNPLRNKVDSCRYSPKQLFVGTLVFTILLFLLPTTLVYYITFTSANKITHHIYERFIDTDPIF
ncbi:hypothetical protein RUM44_011022 [Polyplax serrata]|uniref:Phosphatidylinositol N-acetylglucosaminyltransferase subunit Q n=1 Tax=Polyplax serrata TaxID=468196 RepID=A0ABR1AP66_POLSC